MIAPRTETQRPTVALVDPVWIGHHATYFRAFIDALIDAGARVIAVCPKPTDLDDLVERHGPDLAVGLLDDPGDSRLLPGREHDPLLTWQRWKLAKEAVDHMEAQSGWRANFVFFAWLDSYLRFMCSASLADRVIGRPWTGLYFRNQHLIDQNSSLLGSLKRRLKGDFVMRSRDCRLVSTVDEHTLSPMEQYSGKPVLLMPDITDETPGDPEVPIARAIRDQAKGRKVIGIVGLEKRKGFLTLLRTARRAAELGEPWFFAFTGVLWWKTLSSSEHEWLQKYLEDPPDNIYLDPDAGLVPDGAYYNGIAQTFDVFFAAYLNSIYNGSSNVLTKASMLERPVIVTEGACLEERTQAFQLGVAVPEDDTEACVKAIRHLLEGQDEAGQTLKPRYRDYFEQHSHARLRENMGAMIETAVSE